MTPVAAAARVGIVLVSHSPLIAAGTRDLALQVAPEVTVVAAGGDASGGLGTDFERITAAVLAADGGAGVVVLCDIGSAVLTAETVIELAGDRLRSEARVADAPLVEGAVAAAVRAQTGGGLDEVCAAAEASRRPPQGGDRDRDGSARPVRYRREVVLVNPEGLHARPAAEFVRLASTFDHKVTVNDRDAKSLLGIMSLGLTKGATVRIEGEPEAAAAVDALAGLVERGFGEVAHWSA